MECALIQLKKKKGGFTFITLVPLLDLSCRQVAVIGGRVCTWVILIVICLLQ